MEKSEIIFIIIAILAYAILSVLFKIPFDMHLIFGSVILAILIIALILKYHQKHENEKISKLAKIIAIILMIIAIITSAYEIWFEKILFVNSVLIFILFLIFVCIAWVFEKNKNE